VLALTLSVPGRFALSMAALTLSVRMRFALSVRL
jgi:hypothetical protein